MRTTLFPPVAFTYGTGGMIACIRREPVHAKIECAIVHLCTAAPRQMQELTLRGETGIRPEYSRVQDGTEIVRREGSLRFAMRRRVARTPPERGALSSRVVVSTRPRRRDRSHRSRSPYASVALSPRGLSYVARDKRSDRFAPNFRHHPGVGGHQTPCYVPITVFTPPGAL